MSSSSNDINVRINAKIRARYGMDEVQFSRTLKEVLRGPANCGAAAISQHNEKVATLMSTGFTGVRPLPEPNIVPLHKLLNPAPTPLGMLPMPPVHRPVDCSQFMCTNPGGWLS